MIGATYPVAPFFVLNSQSRRSASFGSGNTQQAEAVSMSANTEQTKQRRLGVIGIVIEDREHNAAKVNQVLSDHADIIVGRMGIPYRMEGLGVISLIVDGTTDAVGALTGRLGSIRGVHVKSALTTVRVQNED
jgi:putative iron-only hydrogenase system regulator